MENNLKKMEDNLNKKYLKTTSKQKNGIFDNGRRPNFFEYGRQPHFYLNGRQPKLKM
jgi:hypothetical protein